MDQVSTCYIKLYCVMMALFVTVEKMVLKVSFLLPELFEIHTLLPK